MGSLDTIDKNSSSSAELDVLVGSAKEAARIPLPPSLSLNSTIYSIETDYYNKESDLRDETHDVGMSVDSMREGAEDVAQLSPHSKSSMSTDMSMSVKTEYVKLSKTAYVQLSRSRDSTNQRSKASEAPELVNSMSLGSNKTLSVKEAASEEVVPMTRSSSSAQMDSSSRSLSSRKSSGIPLSLTKSRSTQSSMSKSSKQSKASAINNNNNISMSRSTCNSSKVSALENDDLLNSMSLSSQTSSLKGEGIPLSLTKSRSTQSSISKSSKQSKAASAINNNIFVPSSHSSSSALPMSRSTSNSSKVSAAASVEESSFLDDLLKNISLISRTSSNSIPLTLTKSRSTQSSMSTSSKQTKVDVDRLSSLSLSAQSSLNGEDIPLALTKSRSNQSTKSTSSKQAKADSDLLNSLSADSQTSSLKGEDIPVALTKSRSKQSTKSTSSKQAKTDLDLINSMSADSQTSSLKGEGIPLALTKSRSTQSTKSSSSKQAKAEMPLSLPNSMSARSSQKSKSHVEGTPVALTKSRSTQSTKSLLSKIADAAGINNTSFPSPQSHGSTLSMTSSTSKKLSSETRNGQDAQATPVKIPSSTSKEGLDSKTTIDQRPLNLNLPKRMSSISQKLSPLTLTKSRSNKSTPQTSPQSDSRSSSPMVITALEGNVLWSIMNNEMSHNLNDGPLLPPPVSPLLIPTSTTSKESPEERAAAGLPAMTPRTSLVSAEDEDGSIIWDNSIEMSYSNFMEETNKEENVAVSTDALVSPGAPVSPRKNLRWSSKILGRTGGQRKKMSKSILKQFKKKKNHKKEGQGKLVETIEAVVHECTNKKVCGELDDLIEKVSGEDSNNVKREETVQEEVSESTETDIGKEAVKLVEAACNSFKEMIDVFVGPVIENDIEVPETKLDNNKAKEILVAAKQVFALRQIIEEKSAELKQQGCPEKTGVLTKELSDALCKEVSAFAIVKTLLNSLSSEERGYAVKLGDDVAKASREIESLKCEAVVEIELRL